MDDVETGALMDFLVKTWKGPAYLRLTRQNLPRLTPEGEKWEPLKIHKVRSSGGATSSKRVTLLGTGAGTAEAVKAMEILTPKLPTHAIEVWNVHSLKPFDSMELLEIADRSDLLVSVEDHTVIGGLGSTIAEVLSESLGKKPPLLRIGVQDLFGQSGEANALYEAYGISGQKISEKVLTLLARSS
jgi:transketolase